MPPKSKPNVLLITADQWRGECLSALGHPLVKTPKLDALAADGVLFRNHYSVCAPCGPARASLLTGMYMLNHRSVMNGTPLDQRHTNIALELSQAGYDPVLFGYTDTSLDPRHTPPEYFRRHGYEGILPGFTSACSMPGGDLGPWTADLKAKGYDVPEGPKDIFKPIDGYPGADGRGRTFPPPVYGAGDSITAFLTDRVIDDLGGRSEPWFHHVSYLRPHPPFSAPEPYNAMYSPDDVPRPVRAPSAGEEARIHPWLACALGTIGDWNNAWMQSTESDSYERDVLQVRATYYGMITKVDDAIGRLMAHLKETGAYDNTLIVFTSDHGELLGDHWLFGKRGYFDEGYHIPLIIRDPSAGADGARGLIVENFTESVDVTLTILDWLGLDIPRQCDGASVMPFCRGERPAGWRTEVHWEYDFRDVDDPRVEQALGISLD